MAFVGITPPRVEVSVRAESYQRQTVIYGSTRCGKTNTLRVLCENAAIEGIPVLILDTHGDLSSMVFANHRDRLTKSEMKVRVLFDQRVEVRSFSFNGTGRSINISLNPLSRDILASDEGIAQAARILARMSKVSHSRIDDASNIIALTLQRVRDRGVFIEKPSDIPGAIEYYYDGPMTDSVKRTINDLKVKLSFTEIEPIRSYISEGVPFSPRIWEKRDNGKVPISIIYMGHVSQLESRQFLVGLIANYVYSWMLQQRDGEPKLVFALDEAKNYIPAGASKPPSKEPLIRLMSEGGKFGVGCIYVSHMTKDVDYKSIGHADNIWIGQTKAGQSLKPLRTFIEDKDVMDMIPHLDVGEFLYYRLGVGEHRAIRVRNTVRDHYIIDPRNLYNPVGLDEFFGIGFFSKPSLLEDKESFRYYICPKCLSRFNGKVCLKCGYKME